MVTVREGRDDGKSHRPSRPDTAFLRRRFDAYLTAVHKQRWSEAVGPRRDLADAGFEILFQRRRPAEKGGR